jgi:flagellin
MIQTAEGATDAITNMLQRMRELTIQAGNSTNGTDDKSALAAEYGALANEIDRVAKTTTWGGVTLLNGGAAVGSGTAPTAASSKTLTFVVDASATTAANISVDIKNMVSGASTGFGITVKAGGADAAAGTLVSGITASDAGTLVTMLDASISYVNTARSSMGATINRLQYTIDNLTNISTNSQASLSRIQDVDYSQATSELARRNIIQQAGTAMLAQANQSSQSVLALLIV